jgi:alpha-D-ribose 1-methylphosphonate 5-triphosphate synthase subunit PhnG
MRLQVAARALHELIEKRFQRAPVADEFHWLRAADFLIDLGTRLGTVGPWHRQPKRDHLMTVLVRNVLTELMGMAPIIDRKESLR